MAGFAKMLKSEGLGLEVKGRDLRRKEKVQNGH